MQSEGDVSSQHRKRETENPENETTYINRLANGNRHADVENTKVDHETQKGWNARKGDPMNWF
jgi:hypothetical protein